MDATPDETSASLLQHLSAAVALCGSDRRLVLWNPAFARLWQLDGDWLATRPGLAQLLEHLRDQRRLPEVADFAAWREAQLGHFETLTAPETEAWHLPEVVRDSMRLHHRPITSASGANGDVVACVQLANVLCTLKGDSSIGRKLVELSPTVPERLKLDHNDIRVLAEDMGRELGLHEELFNLVDS